MLVRIKNKIKFYINFIFCEFSLIKKKNGNPSQTSSQAIRQWLIELKKDPLPPVRGRILISALRNETWIEWAVYCACVIRRLGFESTLFFDGKLTNRLYKSVIPRYNFFDMAHRIPGIVFFDLNTEEHQNSNKWDRLIRDWSIPALAYDLHIEEEDIKKNLDKYKPILLKSFQYASRIANNLDYLLSVKSFNKAFLYSGLIGESKVLLEVLRSRNVETFCLEGWAWRPGHMIYNYNAPALEYNIEGWLKYIGEWDETKEQEMKQYLKFLNGEDFSNSTWLSNLYKVQRSNIQTCFSLELRNFLSGDQPVFLLAPNVIGDSSMLNRHTIFSSEKAWIKEIIEWFKVRPQIKLIIRAHPGEVWTGQKCQIHIGKFASQESLSVKNIFVIDGFDKMNTFSLIPFVRAGLVWISNIGVDFVLRGLPVLSAAKPKYSGLGIVHEPISKTDYFKILDKWVTVQERPTRSQIIQGKKYLYVIFKRFSFEAFSPSYKATGLAFDKLQNSDNHNNFYKILIGDIQRPDYMMLQ